MKTKAIIIAGPQSSGKTSVIDFLAKKFPQTRKHQEVNPYVFFGKKHLGSVFVSCAEEKRIIEYDLKRLKSSNFQDKDKVHLIETGPFHIVYIQLICGLICGAEFMSEFQLKYLKAFEKFSAVVLFIDTLPKISWTRRFDYYLKKSENEAVIQGLRGNDKKIFIRKMMQKYQERLNQLYPVWKKCCTKLPYQKVIIDNNHQEIAKFQNDLTIGFKKCLDYLSKT